MEQKICSNCGCLLPHGARICHNCGWQLTVGYQETPELEPIAAPVIPEEKTTRPEEGLDRLHSCLQRGEIALEDGEWEEADRFFEDALALAPQSAEAYLGKLMAERKIPSRQMLKSCARPFDDSKHYSRAMRFGDAALKKLLQEANESVRCNGIYEAAKQEMNAAATLLAYTQAAERFAQIPNHRDAAELAALCRQKGQEIETARLENLYRKACDLLEQKLYLPAAKAFEGISHYRDAAEQAERCRETAKMERLKSIYQHAQQMQKSAATPKAFINAAETFEQVLQYEDAAAKAKLCRETAEQLRLREEEKRKQAAIARKKRRNRILCITAVTVLLCIAAYFAATLWFIPAFRYRAAEALFDEGKYLEAAIAFGKAGSYSDARERSLVLWEEVAVRETISAGGLHTVGMKADGTVVAVGKNDVGQCEVSGWSDIVAISAGDRYTVGLKADGTVVAVGDNDDGQCEVSGWRDIVAISAGYRHTVGLKADGTVVAVGPNYDGRCEVSSWRDIVAISAGDWHTVGLKADGTVVAVGDNGFGQCGVSDWTNIVAISAGVDHTVGLKADGTVVAVGSNRDGKCDVSGWRNIVAISAGYCHTVGLKADGTVVAVGNNDDDQCVVSGWSDIVAISAGSRHTVGLKADGTVVAVGYNRYGQCDVSGWRDIKRPKK